MKTISIDSRMILSSGIGRYLRFFLSAISGMNLNIILLGNGNAIYSAGFERIGRVLEMKTSIYNPVSQFELAYVVPDSDLFFSPHFATTFLPVRAKKRLITIHDLFHVSDVSGFGILKKTYSRKLLSSSISRADTILTVSRFTKHELIKEFPRESESKIRVIPNCVDPSVFYPQRSESDRTAGQYVLFVGNLKPHKNLGTAIEAVRTLADTGIRLIVAGSDTGFIHGLGKELEEWKKEPYLEFTGPISDEELRRLYSNALCLVLPSHYEGFGYPALEAMACGCPVVCSDILPLHEVCGEMAQYCEPDQSEIYSRNIRNLIENDYFRNKFVSGGLELSRNFSNAIFSEKIREMIEELL